MSLSVNIKSFTTIKIRPPKQVRLQFRNVMKQSSVYTQTKEYLKMDESFRWDLEETPLGPGDKLIVYFTDTDKVLGEYRLDLQVPLINNSLEVMDAMASNENNTSALIFVEMQIFYDPVGDPPGLAKRMADLAVKIPNTAIPSVPEPRKVCGNHQPIHRHALASSGLKSVLATSNTDLNMPVSSNKIITSPLPLKHASPKSHEITTSPQASKPYTSSLPCAFHQALRIKYGNKNEKDQLSSSPSSSQSSQHGSFQSLPQDLTQSSVVHSDGDDTDQLIQVQQNIATLERLFLREKNKDAVIEIASGDDRIRDKAESRGAKLKQIRAPMFRRRLSFGESAADREVKCEPASELVPKHKGKKSSTFRSMRNLMRWGKRKNHDSSGDEEIGLLNVAAGTSAPDVTSEQTVANERIPPGTQETTRNIRHWSFGESAADRQVKYEPASELVPKHKSKKTSTFRSMRNLMRWGKPKKHDSSGDEEIGLLDVAAGTSAPDVTSEQTVVSPEEIPMLRIPPGTQETTRNMCSNVEPEDPIAQKPADLRISVRVIEARQLAGLNVKVAVQVGENKKYTTVKENTN